WSAVQVTGSARIAIDAHQELAAHPFSNDHCPAEFDDAKRELRVIHATLTADDLPCSGRSTQ
ncbi:MAG: hypothetical protein ACR2PZ_06710, partial [Pseudomonadales bacterium]